MSTQLHQRMIAALDAEYALLERHRTPERQQQFTRWLDLLTDINSALKRKRRSSRPDDPTGEGR